MLGVPPGTLLGVDRGGYPVVDPAVSLRRGERPARRVTHLRVPRREIVNVLGWYGRLVVRGVPGPVHGREHFGGEGELQHGGQANAAKGPKPIFSKTLVGVANRLEPSLFEIAEAVCTQRRAQVERFLIQCEKLGAWVAIEDFSFDSQVLPLLRSKAVRLVKIDPKLTSSALKDKLSQALVVATVQAAKVMGIHCAAKRVESQAALQWLTAIGCDFAQGAALAPAQPLEALANAPDPTTRVAALRST